MISEHARKLSRWLLLVLMITTASATILALANLSAAQSPSPASTVTLRVGLLGDVDSLNPFASLGSSVAQEVFNLNYDRLVGYDAATMEPKPALATDWTHSDDGRTWTFQLRRGVTWQDGEPFTASDVAWTYNFIIKNHAVRFTSYTKSISRVVVVDEYTVQFICTEPKADMLGMLVPILPEHIWAGLSPDEAQRDFPNEPPVIGTGPFQVVEWKKGEYTRLVANENYWGGAPKVDQVLLKVYQNATTMAWDLKKKAVDVAVQIPVAQFKELKGTTGVSTIEANQGAYTFLDFNCFPAPDSLGAAAGRDIRFRQAMNWAVNKDEIISVAFSGYGEPATTNLAAGYWGFPWHWSPTSDQAYGFDLAKARELLAAAGYKDTDGDSLVNDPQTGGNVVLRLNYPNMYPEYAIAAKQIAGWFGEVGVKVKVQPLDVGALLGKLYNMNKAGKLAPDFDLLIWNWAAAPDPQMDLSNLTASQIGGFNDAGWINPEYEKLFLQESSLLEREARKDVVWQMQELAYQETPMIVLVYRQIPEAYNSADWSGWVRSPANGGVVMTWFTSDTYRMVEPRAAASSESMGSSTSWWIYAVITAAVAVIAFVVIVVMRARRRREEIG